jgi:hypothetical protein
MTRRPTSALLTLVGVGITTASRDEHGNWLARRDLSKECELAEEDDDLILEQGDAGAAFRAEMAATNMLLGYWKHLVAVIVVFLACVLFYGWYDGWHTSNQRAATKATAMELSALPVPIERIPMLIQMEETLASLPPDEKIPPYFSQLLGVPSSWTGSDVFVPSTDELKALAGSVEALGNGFTDTAKAEALLKAAELYRLAGDTEGRRRALEAAQGAAKGALEFAAVTALANLDLEDGRGEEAVNRLRTLTVGEDDFLAQQAMLDLGVALEHLDRGDEAGAVYADFLVRWPDAEQADEVRSRSRSDAG